MYKKHKTQISDEERALFREAVQHVTPLTFNNQTAIPGEKHPRSLLPCFEEKPLQQNCIKTNVYAPIESVGPETILQFAQSGLQARVLKKLSQGAFKIEAILDLHGVSMKAAETLLDDFLIRFTEEQYRCVQIIHGKGSRSHQFTPLIKNAVNCWLRRYSSVLAFCSAKPYDGGAGAVYVLLRQV